MSTKDLLQKSNSERLPNALRRKDAKAVAALIAKGADHDALRASGQSARTIAAELGVSGWPIIDQADDSQSVMPMAFLPRDQAAL